jgi:hypothetical protein
MGIKRSLLSRASIFSASLGFVLLGLAGCSDITGPRLFTDFQWGEVEVPEDVVEGISTAVALGELFILGQFNTPTRCYALEADFNQSGKNLTLRVKAKSNNSPNCDESLGGFRYTATVRNLKYQTYTLRVIHDVAGASGVEFTETVTIG